MGIALLIFVASISYIVVVFAKYFIANNQHRIAKKKAEELKKDLMMRRIEENLDRPKQINLYYQKNETNNKTTYQQVNIHPK